MTPLTIYILEKCPYCIQAIKYLQQLGQEAPFQHITIEYIDEQKQPELANAQDYYYVPSFYVDNNKLYEGAITKDQMRAVLLAYLQLA